MYPNAYDGIKKIYLAEILTLISTIIACVATVVAAIGLKSADGGAEDIGAASAIVGGGAVLIISGIIILVAFILNILGISRASKDEENFKKAMTWLLISLIGSLAAGFTKDGSFINLACDLVYQIGNILVTFYVIDGVISLARKIGREDLVSRGTKLKGMIIAVYVIGFALTLISGFMKQSDAMSVISGVLAVIALIVMIVAYVMYLKLLSGGKKMLA